MPGKILASSCEVGRGAPAAPGAAGNPVPQAAGDPALAPAAAEAEAEVGARSASAAAMKPLSDAEHGAAPALGAGPVAAPASAPGAGPEAGPALAAPEVAPSPAPFRPVLRPALGAARELLLEALSPTRCASCERPGALICPSCRQAMVRIDPKSSCTRCGAPFGSLVCTECGAQHEPGEALRRGRPLPRMDRCLAATVFKGPPARIVRAYKDAGERRLAPLIAGELLDAAVRAEAEAPERYGGLISGASGIVFVPATAEAYCRRGFDHMELVARALAADADAPLVDALVKHGSADQRALGRQGRFAGARGAFEVVLDVRGARLLLVDDVITTGATASAAAEALKRAGAQHVDVLAFARVW